MNTSKLLAVLIILTLYTFPISAQTEYQKRYEIPNFEISSYLNAKKICMDDETISFAAPVEWNGELFLEGEPQGISVITTDHEGHVLWNKYYTVPGHRIVIEEMIKTSDYGILLTGYVNRKDSYYAKPWILKINREGNKEWSRILDNLGSISIEKNGLDYVPNGLDAFTSIIENHSGNYVVAGATNYECDQLPYDHEDKKFSIISIMEFTPDGSLHQEAKLEFSDNQDIYYSDIVKTLQAPTSNEYFLITSNFSLNLSSLAIINLDTDFTILNKRNYHYPNGDIMPTDALIKENGQIEIVGNTHTPSHFESLFYAAFQGWGSPTTFHRFIPKKDTIKYDYTIPVYPSINYCDQNNSYISGTLFDFSYSSNRENPGIFRFKYPGSISQSDVMIYGNNNIDDIQEDAHSLSDGTWVSLGWFNDQIYTVKSDRSGNSNCLQSTISITSFNSTVHDRNLSMNSYYENSIPITQYPDNLNNLPVNVIGCFDEISTNDPFEPEVSFGQKKPIQNNIFPNPSSGRIQLELGNIFDKTMPVVGYLYNVLGKEVKRFESLKSDQTLHLKSLPKGQYILSLRQGETRDQLKIILQ